MGPDAANRPLRVLHVLGTFGTGGTEQGVANLVNHADPGRVEAGICVLELRGVEEGLDRLRRRVFFRSLDKGFGNDPRVGFRLARALAEGGFDIVHSHGWPTYLETRLALALRRRVVGLHGEHGTSFLDRRRRRWAFGAFSGRFRRFLFVSERLREEFRRTTRIDPYRMVVIPTGVDFSRFGDGPNLRHTDPDFAPGLL
ncbi:MAG: glycosyltransferase family 4 protein, partial [Planctomycetota bacterium]